MATSAEGKTRLVVQTIASGVTGLTTAGQVSLGIKNIAPTSDYWGTFTGALSNQVSIGAATLDDVETQDLLPKFTVPVILRCAVTPNSNDDLTAHEDLASLLRAALNNTANYTTVAPPVEIKCSGGGDTLDQNVSPNWIITYTFKLTFWSFQ